MQDEELVKKYGTPLFIIDLDRVEQNYLRMQKAFPESIIAYSCKTNNHPAILKRLVELGSHIEITSLKELELAKKLGIAPSKILFNGLAQTADEYEKLAGEGLFSITLNSLDELQRFSDLNLPHNIGIRIKSSKDARIGALIKDIGLMQNILNKNNTLKLQFYMINNGTNISDVKIFKQSLQKLKNISGGKGYINIGGGFASAETLHRNGTCIEEFGKELSDKLTDSQSRLIIEPGRYLVEDACYCISRITGIDKNNVYLDISTNFLKPLTNNNYRVGVIKGEHEYDFTGRLCYDWDIIKKNVKSQELHQGQIIDIYRAGAYTYSMMNEFMYDAPKVIVKGKNNV